LLAALIAGEYALAEIVQGIVVADHSGQPQSRAEVTVLPEKAGLPAVTLETDDQGRFQLEGFARGNYRIEVAKPNYASTALQLTIPLEAPRTVVWVRLVRLGSISGRITDSRGEPVAGAIVHALFRTRDDNLHRLNAPTPGYVAKTDGNGRYRLYNLPQGEYVVAAVPYGRWSGTVSDLLMCPQSLLVSGGEELDNVDLAAAPAPGYAVSGTVETPQPGKTFSVAIVKTSLPGLAVGEVLTDQSGQFRISGVSPSSYDVLAAGPVVGRGPEGALLAANPVFGRAHVEVAAQDVGDITVPVTYAVSARFTLISTTAAPARRLCPQGIKLALASSEDWGVQLGLSLQLTPGDVRVVDRLPPARYYLAAVTASPREDGSCYPDPPAILDLTNAAGERQLTVPATEGGSIRGELAGATRPWALLAMLGACDPPMGHGQIQISYPDSRGQFRFPAVSPRCYWLAVRPASAAPPFPVSAQWSRIDVTDGGPTEVRVSVTEDGAGR
jgi:hypothetical protein